MDISAFPDLIASQGFPIACVIALAFVFYKMIVKVMVDQKEREDKLYTELGECRIINEKAITTIAQYATRLESIQEDVKDIKMDMTTIKAKVDK